MNHVLALAVAGATLVSVPHLARAEVPETIPVQGFLTDASGVPIDGTQAVTFSIYASAASGDIQWTETQSILISEGSFTAYLGEVMPLGSSVFNTSTRWLSIKVGSDDEMMPRLRLGSVPYAARAAECDSVPSGSIMFFDLEECPTGWTEFAPMQGRVPLGLPAGGTRGDEVGTALGPKGLRAISQVPAHVHSIDPPSRASTGAGAHSHPVDPPVTDTVTNLASFNGSHAHSGTTDATNVVLDMSSGGYSTSYVQGAASNGSVDTNEGAPADSHTHSISLSGGTHQHRIDIGSFASGSVSNHTHDVDIPSFNSASTGAASVDVTMPYVQVKACRKD